MSGQYLHSEIIAQKRRWEVWNVQCYLSSMDSLKRMQHKPNTTKTRYAFVIALSITLLVGFVWSTTLPARFASIGNVSQNKTDKSAEETETPFNSFSEILDEAKSQVGAIADWDSGTEEEIITNNLNSLGSFGGADTDSNLEITDENTVSTDEVMDVTSEEVVEEVQTEPAEHRTVLIEVKKSEAETTDDTATAVIQ